MSTYVGYRCLTHQPVLDSEYWYNHGFEKLAKTLVNREDIFTLLDKTDLFDTMPQEVEWLRNHRSCNVTIVNEYGETYDFGGNRIPSKVICPKCAHEFEL